MLENLAPQAPDKILELMGLFRQDTRTDKIDLGVGVYKDASGLTPIFRAVKAAEERIWQAQDTKVYTGLAGDPAFGDAMIRLILARPRDERTAAIAAPGGTGAVQKGLELARLANPHARVHVPAPTWPNHLAILRHLGLRAVEYPYFDAASGGVRLEEMLGALGEAMPGDVVLLHGCCHNPTGADPDAEGWDAIGTLLEARGVTVLVDLAYQGFGDGLEADAAATRRLAERLPEVMIAASCSKNFGVYRERTGILIALTGSADLAQGAMAALNRMNYSFPPDHGARIVQTILDDDALRADWQEELEGVRAHMIRLRESLAQALRERTNSDRFDFVARHRGMFSRLGLAEDQVMRLRAEHGVYMTSDSRMNVAGLNAGTVPVLAGAVADVL